MVGYVRFVNVKLLTRKLGVTEINIVPNIFARFVSPKYGLEYRSQDMRNVKPPHTHIIL